MQQGLIPTLITLLVSSSGSFLVMGSLGIGPTRLMVATALVIAVLAATRLFVHSSLWVTLNLQATTGSIGSTTKET